MGTTYTVFILNEDWGLWGMSPKYDVNDAEKDLLKLYPISKIIGKTDTMLVADIYKNNVEDIYFHVKCDSIYSLRCEDLTSIDAVKPPSEEEWRVFKESKTRES